MGRGVHKSHKRGTAHHLAKLTEDEVRDIRKRYAEGETITDIWLSLDHIESMATVQCVTSGRTWKHVK